MQPLAKERARVNFVSDITIQRSTNQSLLFNLGICVYGITSKQGFGQNTAEQGDKYQTYEIRRAVKICSKCFVCIVIAYSFAIVQFALVTKVRHFSHNSRQKPKGPASGPVFVYPIRMKEPKVSRVLTISTV